jgi:hypothetical protein
MQTCGRMHMVEPGSFLKKNTQNGIHQSFDILRSVI